MRKQCDWVWLAVALMSCGCGTKQTSDSATGDAGRSSTVVAEGDSSSHGPAFDDSERMPDDLDELSREFDQKLKPLAAKLRQEQSQELMTEYQTLVDTYVNHAIGLAEKNPTAPETADVLAWAIARGNGTPAVDRARQLFIEHFADSNKVTDLLMPAMYRPSSDDAALAERVLQINTDRTAQAIATMVLAKHQLAVQNPERAEELLAKIEKEYGDIDVRGTSLGEMVRGELFELRFLQVGMEAPEITADDIDGTEFNLSDYRGQVVMLDFWGDW